MSDHAGGKHDRSVDRTPDEPDALASIEAYETENGVVIYDAENPLAWLESSRTVSLRDSA
ncbi:MAG TPA: hypothetical protein VJ898_12400 [Natrialbaceae archaeon]|nr:hypothetical protein [Natrialbaceae archaeon]